MTPAAFAQCNASAAEETEYITSIYCLSPAPSPYINPLFRPSSFPLVVSCRWRSCDACVFVPNVIIRSQRNHALQSASLVYNLHVWRDVYLTVQGLAPLPSVSHASSPAAQHTSSPLACTPSPRLPHRKALTPTSKNKTPKSNPSSRTAAASPRSSIAKRSPPRLRSLDSPQPASHVTSMVPTSAQSCSTEFSSHFSAGSSSCVGARRPCVKLQVSSFLSSSAAAAAAAVDFHADCAAQSLPC